MDALTASTAFATIMGLVCNYAAERRNEANPFAGFMEYLRESHDEIRRGIEGNAALANGLRALLSQNTEVVIQKLERLDGILAGVAANLGDFRAISVAVHSEEVLSEEALGILNQFYDSGDGRFLQLPQYDQGGLSFHPLDSGADAFELNYRFLEADLRTLCTLGFLDIDYNSNGDRILLLTRQAERYIKAIREMTSSSTPG